MSKRSRQSYEESRHERIEYVKAGLIAAKSTTGPSVFGEPDTEQVFMTFDLVIDGTESVEEAEEVVKDLKAAVEIAKTVWGDRPTEEQVTGCYYRAFPDGDDE
jgi:hypothetical protein